MRCEATIVSISARAFLSASNLSDWYGESLMELGNDETTRKTISEETDPLGHIVSFILLRASRNR